MYQQTDTLLFVVDLGCGRHRHVPSADDGRGEAEEDRPRFLDEYASVVKVQRSVEVLACALACVLVRWGYGRLVYGSVVVLW